MILIRLTGEETHVILKSSDISERGISGGIHNTEVIRMLPGKKVDMIQESAFVTGN